MSSRLFVKNWKKFQHYRDRRPPWIKLATDVFQNPDFAELSDASKLLAICIWTLASCSDDGSVLDNFEYIHHWGFLGKEIRPEHLKLLIDKGFLSCDPPALAPRKQSAMPEGEGEGETDQRQSTEDDLRKQTATQLRDICRQVLGVDFNKNLSSWSKQKLTDLETDHKGFALVRAFTDWANDNRLSPPEAPVAAFLSVSDIYLKPTPSVKSGVSGLTAMEGTDDELEKLCTALYAVGRQLFPEKMQNVLRELLGRFEAGEILDAWKEYTAGMDDTDLKYAPKKFCEGGVSIILTRRADLEKARKDQELLGRLMEQRQAEVAAEDAVEEEPMEDLMRAE